MNRKSALVLLLICGLFLAAVLARNGQVLLLALPLAVYLAVGMWRWPGPAELQAERTTSAMEVLAGEPFDVQITLRNRGRRLTNVLLADVSQPGLNVQSGAEQKRTTLGSGEETRIQYSGSAARGSYRWSGVRVTASDPCGLFESRSNAIAPGEVLSGPGSMRLRGVRLSPRTTLHAPGPMPARLPGSGTDFWGVREYRAGDPLRRLNWRMAGRHPRRMFTNEFEGEELADYGLILDARRLTDTPSVDEALFEAMVTGAASLSESFLQRGNRVALLVFGDAPVCLFPGYGKRQLHRVRQALSSVSLGRNVRAWFMESFAPRLFPSRSLLFMFSSVAKRDLETYRRLRSFGYEVVLVSPDPVEYASRQLAPSPLNRLAVRAASLERGVQLKALAKLGISVLDWHVGEPLDAMLRTAAVNIAHRRNM